MVLSKVLPVSAETTVSLSLSLSMVFWRDCEEDTELAPVSVLCCAYVLCVFKRSSRTLTSASTAPVRSAVLPSVPQIERENGRSKAVLTIGSLSNTVPISVIFSTPILWLFSRLSFVVKVSIPFALCKFKKCRKKVSNRSDSKYDLVPSAEYSFELSSISESYSTACQNMRLYFV